MSRNINECKYLLGLVVMEVMRAGVASIFYNVTINIYLFFLCKCSKSYHHIITCIKYGWCMVRAVTVTVGGQSKFSSEKIS